MESARPNQDFETLEITMGLEDVLPALVRLEAQGFFGMTLTWSGDTVRVVAWKKRDEPCYETGRSVSYLGNCLAVGDDDHHFIGGTIRVCEKTGRVYASEAYRAELAVSEADPALLARLATDPVPFDCDTLARDAEEVAARVDGQPEPAEKVAVYLGPFRYIVLENGTILRRGIPAALSRAHAEHLVSGAAAAAVDLPAAPAPNFADLYRRHGPLFLVGRGGGQGSIRMPDFGALEGLSESTHQRLSKMLDRGDDYFMLQGTDPAVGGCCPLPQVGESNRLVEAGILDSWASPMDSDCPITAYAMAGEVGDTQGGIPRFRKNGLLRLSVRALLKEQSAS
ncbi:MAG: hypothetical protein HY900_30165 [Deltaproteobacteria bacterium]|nr:hypothetical protein [Deltaproteobacteria bacterium]